MKRVLLLALAVFCMANSCDDPPPPIGKIGSPCYPNGTCDGVAVCISWKKDGGKQSVCAAPEDVVIGAFDVVKYETKCPEPPVVHCPDARLQPGPPPAHCPPPVKCPPPRPSPSPSPCADCKPCQPGWKRGKS